MLTLSYGGNTFTFPNLEQHPLAFDGVDDCVLVASHPAFNLTAGTVEIAVRRHF